MSLYNYNLKTPEHLVAKVDGWGALIGMRKVLMFARQLAFISHTFLYISV